MPEFAYIAKDTRGSRVQGTISASGRREAFMALTGKSLFPLEVHDAVAAPAWSNPLGRRIKPDVVAANLSQLGDLLSGGVALLKALNVLADQAPQPAMKEILIQVRDAVADGTTLHDALAKHPQAFSDLTVNMVRAGSAGAFLEEALERTGEFLTRQQELKSKVKGAMAYPAFLAVAGLAVTVALIVFFVPKFSELFAKLEQQGGLPWATQMLLGLSDALSRYGILILAAIVGLFAAVRHYANTERGLRQIDAARLKIPFLGPVVQGYAVARFCRVLGTLLRNGVPILKSLEISSRATANRIFADAIEASSENISAGDELATPLAASGLFPPSVMAMIHVAEEANNLDHVLLLIADRIERQNEQRLDVLVRLLEPILLLVMGMLMFFVIVALLLPVFDMSSAIG